MNKTLVTIVIPAYNHAKYLKQAIDSVLSQDYQNIELIVLDDGSTDNTLDLLKSYGNLFVWERHENMGQANTLNKGWKMAKGDILSYLSADDFLLPHAVRVSIENLLENPDAVLSYGDFQLVDSESRVVRNVSAPDYSYEEMVTNYICAPGPGVFFRRDAYLKAGGWDSNFRQSPDYEYWLRLGLTGWFMHINNRLAAFRVHEESQTFAPTTITRADEPLKIIQKYYNLENIPVEIFNKKKKAFANANFVSAQLHLRSGRYKLGFSNVYKAILISPQTLFSLRLLRMLANGLFNRGFHKLLQIIRQKI